MAGDAKVVFVVGSPRSGTTLVAGLLNQLPGVWIGKETGFIPRLQRDDLASVHEWDGPRLEGLVEVINSYLRIGRWATVASADGARRFWTDTGTTGFPGLIRYVWSLDQAPDASAVAVRGDQTPTYVLALPLLERLFPDASYVHVVRDPRDVVASILPLGFGARSAGVAASDWNECVAGWWAAERRVPPGRRFEVRYEDLVTDPGATLERLATFLDATPARPDQAPVHDADALGLAALLPHHARLAQPIDEQSVGRHHRDLSPRDRELVEAVTYTGLVTYGYEVGPFRPSPVLQEDAVLLTRERLRDLRGRAVGHVVRRWRR